MRRCLFVRLVATDDKADGLAQAIPAVREGCATPTARLMDPDRFRHTPGTVFPYWLSPNWLSLFSEQPALSSMEGCHVFRGITTAEDFRFLRCWWEVAPSRVAHGYSDMWTHEEYCRQTFDGCPWMPYVNGGPYSPFHFDVNLLVNWQDNGVELKSLKTAFVRNEPLFFKPGVFQTLRSAHLAPAACPSGCIVGQNGFQLIAPKRELVGLLGYLNSDPAEYLYQAQLGRFGYALYVVGAARTLPVPRELPQTMYRTTTTLVTTGQREACKDELCHLFSGSQQASGHEERLVSFQGMLDIDRISDSATAMRELIDGLNHQSASALNLQPDDLTELSAYECERALDKCQEDSLSDDPDQSDNTLVAKDVRSTTVSLLSYALGCAFGRWDIRYATGKKTSPELPDPFAPLPVCPPGMLQGEDGLPLMATPTGYPLRINWNGILVDEPNHSDDILKRVREALHLLWPETSDSIEAEISDALGVKELRDYFRKPGSGGFWMDHVHMYSKSHRKAPIYWLLQSSHKNYGVWLYYQRLDSDLLFKVLQNYVEPKLKLEQNHETEASHKLTAGGLSVSETRQAQKDLEKQQDLVAEIRDFRDTLKKAADLRLTPDLDDGVVLNIAPLHDLVPWAEAAKYWDELLAGKYPWSSIGKQLEQKGMV